MKSILPQDGGETVQIVLPYLQNGLYLMELRNEKGELVDQRKFLIER